MDSEGEEFKSLANLFVVRFNEVGFEAVSFLKICGLSTLPLRLIFHLGGISQFKEDGRVIVLWKVEGA